MSAGAQPLPFNEDCPRCGQPFRCGVSDGHCACFGLQIGEALRRQIAAQYSGCLCVRCLTELQLQQTLKPAEPPR
ncbi:MAG TPA: cysteine-rich CWC family protein [Roseateles sp.]|nr:cysteine-rich CWC family protein [Roseateles sp.]